MLAGEGARRRHRMPESWHWPEKRAANILQRDGWQAGLRVLQEAAILTRNNANALEDCRKWVAKAKMAVSCSIKVPKAVAQ